MHQHFVLLIQEPAFSLQRAIQVNGLPFTIGSTSDAAVRLQTPGTPCVRVESMENGYRVLDLEGSDLRVGDEPANEAALRHGSTFKLGEVTVRFFVGTVESLRKSVAAPVEGRSSGRILAYLDRLEDIERRLKHRVEGTASWVTAGGKA